MRRLLKFIAVFIGLIAIVTTIVVQSSGDEDFTWPADDNVVNDITGLNRIRVARVIVPDSVEEISAAIARSTAPISIGGGRFSQGGQIAYPNSLHIDMRSLDQVIAFDTDKKEITVQAGITWRKLQEYIDASDLSVKIMQTYANFTVGGSLSVNVHGRYIGQGPLVHSVNSIKMVMADGSVWPASRTENAELFYGAIGGYGGLGVIVEATLQLADNVKIERKVKSMPISRYRDHFFAMVRDDPDVVLHNADIYPPDYENVLDVSWYKTEKPLTIDDRLIATDEEYFWGPLAAEFVASFDIGKKIRESLIDPVYYGSDRVVWRNWEASYDVRELEPGDRAKTTYALREYFIPVESFDAFVPRMREIFNRHQANIINVSIRHARPDPNTLLSWANSEVFAFVVYYRQGTDAAAKERVKRWSVEMIDAAIEAGGTYYLPYQIFASPQQFLAAYPQSPRYFDLKDRVDPAYRFRNKLWSHYYPVLQDPLKNKAATIPDYFRGEEQTFLTIPEWYLVFNPVEYADFLEAGENPSDFPFMDSIDEYWSLYDRVIAISAAGGYPENSEYMTMLKVIGISTTVEYLFKSLYENTIGRFTRWTAGGEDTGEDKIIQMANRAYSELIFERAWYEFDFWSWVARVWREPALAGSNMIRKYERKLFFTVEYGFKTLYAKLVAYAARTAYEPGDGLIYLTAEYEESEGFAGIGLGEVVAVSEDAYLLAVPRWGEFTKTIPVLVAGGFDFRDISGNDRIAVSVIVDSETGFDTNYADLLFSSNVVSEPALSRLVMLVPVPNLREFVIEVRGKGYQLEHIYDY
jgi:FAD/FMN-containing dehydrogenase